MSAAHVRELHQQITREVIEEHHREMEELRADDRATQSYAADQAEHGMQTLRDVGIDVDKLEEINRKRNEDADARYEAVVAEMRDGSQEATERASELDLHGAFVPEAAQALTPSWVALFSSQDKTQKLSAGHDVPSEALVSGGSCRNACNRASGGGWGCAGSGVGQRQDWIVFGFWFRPTVNKFYTFNPLFRFRGFYIVRANDGFWDCKHARVTQSVRVNVWQYNWKGYTSEVVHTAAGDNINVNKRLDTDRYTHNSYLLGGNDWAWVQCEIGLHVRAQGSGSTAHNDFSTGNANYLCVPHMYVS